MAILTDLPTELLEQIYHSLGSIDDVHRLARSCKNTYHAIQNEGVYAGVMRSIIHQSRFHRFDLQLCYLLDLHREVVKHLEAGRDLLPQTRLYPGGGVPNLNTWETKLSSAALHHDHFMNHSLVPRHLSDVRIFEILARWQGLRVMQDMWLSKELDKADYLSYAFSNNPSSLVGAYGRLLERSDCLDTRPSRYSEQTVFYTSFNADQKGRFHAALIALWFLNEVRWLLAHFETVNSVCVPLKILDNVMQEFEKQSETALVDRMDQMAMYQFLYQHLLPLHIPALADQTDTRLPLTFSSDFDKVPEHSGKFLQLCLLAGQTYLQPPDLIELAVRNKLQRRYPYPLPHTTDTTHNYMFPSRTIFPLNLSITDNSSSTQYALRHRASILINTIQRASVTQTSYRLPRGVQQQDALPLFHIPDLLEEWLTRRCLRNFDMKAREDNKILKMCGRWRGGRQGGKFGGGQEARRRLG